MWANAQRDGRPVEYRWHPLFNSTKFGWRPLLECRAVTRPRHETRWNLQGCPKLPNRSQPLVGSPYYEDMWRRYCCLTSVFFRLSIYALVAQVQPNKVVRWCRDSDFLNHLCVRYFQWAACSTFQTCILNSHYSHTMCRSMVDSHSAIAEIRRGKRRRRKKIEEETTGQKYNGLLYSIGWPLKLSIQDFEPTDKFVSQSTSPAELRRRWRAAK